MSFFNEVNGIYLSLNKLRKIDSKKSSFLRGFIYKSVQLLIFKMVFIYNLTDR